MSFSALTPQSACTQHLPLYLTYASFFRELRSRDMFALD